MSSSILILYREVMGYTIAGIKQLACDYDGQIILIEDTNSKLTPFTFKLDTIIYKSKKDFKDRKHLVDYSTNLNANVVLCAGWIDKDYIDICKVYKNKGVQTVCMLDTQWHGTIRQYIASYFTDLFLKRIFSQMWGSGMRQYEFAKRMGYNNSQIKIGFYTCDYDIYHATKNDYTSKNILFIGRFVKEKGIQKLVKAFTDLSSEFPDWKLTLIGNGDIGSKLLNEKIVIKNFKQPTELVDEFGRASIFCLPSNYEPWGVVIHEAVTSGLPILCSVDCGSSDSFVRNGYNGFTFDGDLTDKLKSLMEMSPLQLKDFGENSRKLSHDFNPKIWSATVMTLINE